MEGVGRSMEGVGCGSGKRRCEEMCGGVVECMG